MVRTLAAFGVDRLSRAVDAYWELGDPFAAEERQALSRQKMHHGRKPMTRRPALAELAVDASTGVEALISALRYERQLRADRNKPVTLLTLILAEPELEEGVRCKAEQFVEAFKYAREARNSYLHSGAMPPDNQRTGAALRDCLELGLRLAAGFPSLRQRWNEEAWCDVDESLWRFVGQPGFIADQVRCTFSGRQFRGLVGRLHVRRHGDSGRFFLGGPLTITGDLEQARWGYTGAHSRLLELPGINAEIGIVPPPRESEATECGEEIVDGELELVARDLPVRFDGFGPDDNPLLEPIYLREGENSPWINGPGDVKLAWLKLTIPYRARTTWYPTPEPRLHILSEFLDCDVAGTASGELRFSLPGHAGRSAFKGKALIGGRVGPASGGRQLAEWRLFTSGEERSRRSGEWAGVSRLAFWSDLAVDIAFSRF